MKKINTILIVLILAIVSLFGVVGCESSSQNELQSKIDELQSRIEELEEQIRERDERIKELEGEIKENQNNEYINYEVASEGVFFDWTDERLNFVGISNSVVEVKSLCEQNKFLFFDEKSTDYETLYGKKIREYESDYFTDKSLIVCAFTESCYPGTLMVENLVIKENALTVQIKYHNDYGYAYDIVVGWVFIVEVDKSSVSSIKSVSYHLV